MPTQIFVIHGGDVFEHYEEYLAALRVKEVSLEKLRLKGWKTNLQERLGDSFEVFNPRMPNAQNARYAEWKIWFEKLAALMSPGVVLIGHSLGGIFLAKYLSEERFPVAIRATFLVAAPFNTKGGHPLVDFVLGDTLGLFAEQAGEVLLYHSQEDHVVLYSSAEAYHHALPRARLVTLTDRRHFHDETFPELEHDLRRLP